jgi:hypothetical protein
MLWYRLLFTHPAGIAAFVRSIHNRSGVITAVNPDQKVDFNSRNDFVTLRQNGSGFFVRLEEKETLWHKT